MSLPDRGVACFVLGPTRHIAVAPLLNHMASRVPTHGVPPYAAERRVSGVGGGSTSGSETLAGEAKRSA
jgi:hypothetical protein